MTIRRLSLWVRCPLLLSIAVAFCLPKTSCAQPSNCIAAPGGLVGWWRGEGDADDFAGDLNGTLYNGTSFAPGRVGQAFVFDGVNDAVVNAVAAISNAVDTYTMEFWAWPAAGRASTTESTSGTAGAGGQRYAIYPKHASSHFPHGYVGSGISVGTNGVSVFEHDAGYLPSLLVHDTLIDGWTHVAVVYESRQPRLYLNGELVHIGLTSARSSSPSTSFGEVGEGSWGYGYYRGLLDEVSIYGRALSQSEIRSIYLAGTSGKCIPDEAPIIFSQPLNISALVGSDVTLTVSATGTAPLSYQWYHNGEELFSQTNTSLILQNVMPADGGAYHVIVENIHGSGYSSNAVLTVITGSECLLPPEGLVNWWRGEDNGVDAQGEIHGTLYGGVGFASGVVGKAFVFDGVNDAVINAVAANTNAVDSYTMEFWAWPTAARASTVESTSGTSGNGGQRYAIYPKHATSHPPAGFVGSGVSVGTNGVSVFEHAGAYLPSLLVHDTPITGWTHVAVVYTNRQPRLYLNGQLVHTGLTSSRSSSPSSWLGEMGPGSANYGPYRGMLDEVSIYSRALSSAEIQSIYLAGAFGKCVPPQAPIILAQPNGQNVPVGSDVSFDVLVFGDEPLAYQWLFDGQDIDGADGSELVLSNVQPAQSGSYAVRVSNLVGQALSQGALLSVFEPPAVLRLPNVQGMAGQDVTIPVLLDATGDENALSFSIQLGGQTSLLELTGVELGAGSSGAILVTNGSQLASGRLGVAVALPAGTSFVQGTHETVILHFGSSLLTASGSKTVTLNFVDQPIAREVSDTDANLVAVEYVGGLLTLTPSDLEADVSPRPTGNRSITLADWVQGGRFVAGLDVPEVGGEFQRADAAPRSSSGNGVLGVSDWIQAGRYFGGIDPLSLIGGPESPSEQSGASMVSAQGDGTDRVVRARSLEMAVGQMSQISVELESQGDENGLSFSLEFDPSLFEYTEATLGSAATGATLVLNTNETSSGSVGVVLALSTGQSFSAGTRQLLQLKLKALSISEESTLITFGDHPAVREVADAAANELSASYQPGILAVNPWPTLGIEKQDSTVKLTWPEWAGEFLLQSTPDNIWTNISAEPDVIGGSNVIVLPTNLEREFFRLRLP